MNAVQYSWAAGHENDIALYYAVTRDKYQLPVSPVCESVSELASAVGVTVGTITRALKNPKNKRYVRVWVPRKELRC